MSRAKINSYALIAGEDGGSGGDSSNGSFDQYFPQNDVVSSAAYTAANARSQTRQRIYSDRVKMGIAVGALVVLTFACAVLGVSVEQFRELSSYRGRGSVVLSIAEVMAALMEEAAHSVAFTDPDMSIGTGDDGLTDRERAAQLTELQGATRRAFEMAVGRHQHFCANCESILSMYSFATLMSVQRNVLMRRYSPKEVYAYYAAGLLRLAGIIALYVGWGVQGGDAAAAWTEQLLFASRGLAFASGSWLDAYKAQDVMAKDSYLYMAMAANSVDIVEAFSPMMRLHADKDSDARVSEREMEETIAQAVVSVHAVLKSATGSFAGMRSEGPATPEESIARTIATYRTLIATVAAQAPWNKSIATGWAWIIGLSSALIAVSITVALVSLREAAVLVWAADEELAQMKATHRLETSLGRMYSFVDALFRLDRVGLEEAVARSEACGSRATNVERELLQLAAPARHVLSYVNPCMRDRCLAAYEADSGGALAMKDATGEEEKGPIAMGLRLQYLSLVMVDLRCFANFGITAETLPTLPKELLIFLNDISSLVTRCEGTILAISGTVLTIGWNVRANGGGAESLDGADSSDGGRGTRRRDRAHSQRDAGPRGTEGSRGGSSSGGVGAGEGCSESPENDACQMLVRFRLTKLQHKYPKVRFAVVSGVCKQGVVGSTTTRAYVVTGNLVMLGRLLLEGARLHDVSVVADTSTFLKLDTQQFRKRALEVMGLYGTSVPVSGAIVDGEEVARVESPLRAGGASLGGGSRNETNYTTFSVASKTVAYELTITGVEANEYALLWNAAFDDFVTGRVDDALRKLAAWRRLFGDRPTLKRIIRLIGEAGGYNGPVYYRPNGTRGFEYTFII